MQKVNTKEALAKELAGKYSPDIVQEKWLDIHDFREWYSLHYCPELLKKNTKGKIVSRVWVYKMIAKIGLNAEYICRKAHYNTFEFMLKHLFSKN